MKIRITFIGQPMYKLKSKPEFIREVPKAISVVDPVPVEVFTAILSPLKDGPSSSISIHVAINIKWRKRVWLDGVDTRSSVVVVEGITAVSDYRHWRWCRSLTHVGSIVG